MKIKLVVLLIFILIISFVSGSEPGCNLVCDPAIDCNICPSDCPSTSYVCCSGYAYIGECCLDSDCPHNGICSNHICTFAVDEPEPVCGDDVCDEGETCTNCCADCICDNLVCCNSVSYAGDCCLDSECISDDCQDHYCAAVETCSDNTKNQDETDTDCGGLCDKCANGKSCQQSSDCISNYCLNGKCSEPPVCNEGERHSCNSSNSCPGNLSCTNGAWTECLTSLNFCDANCDGTNDLCIAQQCRACACIEADDCAEKSCMLVSCEGNPKSCAYINITSCVGDDGCCPADCIWRTDNDCNQTDECSNNTECLDNDLCTIDVCEGNPKACAHHPVAECISGDGCCPSNCTFAADMDCSCAPNWTCQEWHPAECPREKRQKRECIDANNCTNRTNAETRLCTFTSKTPLAGKSTASGAQMLTRRALGNDTNATLAFQESNAEAALNKNLAWTIVIMSIVGAGIIFLLYHEGLFRNLLTLKSRQAARKANMLNRMRYFREHQQSNIMIKTNLIAEGYTLKEISRGLEELHYEARK